MGTMLKKELKRTRRGLIIWSLIVGLTAYLGILEYPILAPYTAMLEETLIMIPRLAQLVFGVYNVNLGDTTGYYIVMYYWAGLVVFTHAIYTGASIIAKEQRDRTAEYLFTMPIKRSYIVWAKIVAGLVNISVVGIITLGMSLLAMIPISKDPVIYGQVLLSGIGMFLTQCVLMAMGLLCSAVGKTYKSGIMLSAAVLLASYSLMFFVQYIDLPALNFLSPLTFFSVSEVVLKGISLFNVLVAALVIDICLMLTQKLYLKKEMIR